MDASCSPTHIYTRAYSAEKCSIFYFPIAMCFSGDDGFIGNGDYSYGTTRTHLAQLSLTNHPSTQPPSILQGGSWMLTMYIVCVIGKKNCLNHYFFMRSVYAVTHIHCYRLNENTTFNFVQAPANGNNSMWRVARATIKHRSFIVRSWL